jgi:hypothetical protein
MPCVLVLPGVLESAAARPLLPDAAGSDGDAR